MPTPEQLQALWAVCEKFILDQKISCAEIVYQTDRVIENAYEFIEDVCDVVGYGPPPYEPDDE